MSFSRNLEDLHPVVRAKAEAHLAACEKSGVHLLITCTYRDNASQEQLYEQGRDGHPGPVVTHAKPGESMHNYRLAYDVVPLVLGKPVWGTTGADAKVWETVGRLGEAEGLEWAGRWTSFCEFPHFQWTGGMTLAQLRGGAAPPDVA